MDMKATTKINHIRYSRSASGASLAVLAALAAPLVTGVSPAFADTVPVTITAQAGRPVTSRLDRWSESPTEMRFVVDADGPVTVTIKPRTFPVVAGHEYSVNFSYYEPRQARAEKDGEITLTLDSPRNCTVVIENSTPNLVPNGGFEDGMQGWNTYEETKLIATIGYGHEFLPDAGADARITRPAKTEVTRVGDVKHGGGFAVRLAKGAGEGFPVIESEKPIPVDAGKTYRFSAHYHVSAPPFGSAIVYRVRLSAPGKADIYFREGLINPLVDTRPEEWRRIYTDVAVPKEYANATASLYIAATGAACVSYWDDLSLRVVPVAAPQYPRPYPVEREEPTYSEAEVRRMLKDRRPLTVEAPKDGMPMHIDGETQEMFGFNSHPDGDNWPHSSDHVAFSRSGVRLQWIPLVANSPWAPKSRAIWSADGKYDFAELEKRILRLAGMVPGARVLVYVSPTPYPAFGDVHPEACWVNANGERSIGDKESWQPATSRKEGESWNLSYTAPAYREQTADFFRSLGKFLASHDCGKVVAGIHMVVGTDGQWFVPGWGRDFGDYDRSPGSNVAFHDWLRRLYKGDVGALRTAWGDPLLTFGGVSLPDEKERETKAWLLREDIPAERRIIDANRFAELGRCETADLFAKSFKEGFGRPTLVTAYYHNKFAGLGGWLYQPNLDGTVGVIEYRATREPGNVGEMATYPASLRVNGKFMLSEMDYRTEYSETWGGETQQYTWVVTRDAEEAASQMRRDMGMALAQGFGGWVYSLPGNGWSTEDHQKYIAEVRKAAAYAARSPLPADRAQVAVFVDERTVNYATTRQIYGPVINYVGHRFPRTALTRSGLTWDNYLLSDLTNPRRPTHYKMYVFLTSGTITPGQIAYVKNNLQKNGNVVIFLSSAGYCVGKPFEENAQELTGMKVFCDREKSGVYRYVATGKDPLADGVEDLFTESPGPLFYVDDPSATPLARLTGTDKVGLAVKRFPGWTSVYGSLLGGITPRLLRNLAAEARIIPVGPEGDATFSGNGIVTIHALSGGRKTLHWAEPSDVMDLTTGEIVARNVREWSLSMESRTTRWFQRTPTKTPTKTTQ